MFFSCYRLQKSVKICIDRSCVFSPEDSLSSGDDEDYDEDPEDAGNGNGEFLLSFFFSFNLYV